MRKFVGLFLLFVFVSVSYAQNRSGIYYRSDANGKGDVTFKDIRRGRIRTLNFNLSVAGAVRGTCFGEIKGSAKWIENGVAEYNGNSTKRNKNGEISTCRLTFIFSNNRLRIRETNCDASHGAACNFEGTYRRR